MGTNQNKPLFIFPDPITEAGMISGATFLYFKQPILFTIPPQVIIKEAYELMPLITDRRPEWGNKFFKLFGAWRQQQEKSLQIQKMLGPLKGKSFKTIWLVYPANSQALENSETLVTSSGLSYNSLFSIIDPFNASGEIIRHIMLEAFLELDKDVEALFNYCDKFFTKEDLPKILTKGYFLRMQMLKAMSKTPILLTNERLIPFLNNLPIDTTIKSKDEVDIDVIAWELFRQILSPYLDPLNTKNVKLITELLKSYRNEIERFRLKCQIVADHVKQPDTLDKLPSQIERIIKTQMKRDIAELLQLDQEALESFFTSLFSDSKVWLGICAFISGVVLNQTQITIGGALGALSLIGANSFKAAADRRQKLKNNDYALIYRVVSKKKQFEINEFDPSFYTLNI